MHRITMIGLALTVALCGQPAFAATFAASSDLSGPVQANSVFRDGDQLHFIIAQPTTRVPPVVYSSQVQASCSRHEAWVAYSEGVRRLYPDSFDGRYHPPVRYEPAQVQALYRNPAVVAACKATAEPQWRLVDTMAAGQGLMIDAHSVDSQGDIRRFWAAMDEPAEGSTLPYDAPRAQTREHLEMNCARGTYQVLAQAVLDHAGRVTDGLMFPPPQAHPVQANGPYQPLFSLMCEQPRDLATQPAYVARPKPPRRASTPYVPAEVIAQVQAVQLPRATRALGYLEQVLTFNGKPDHRVVRESATLENYGNTGLTLEQREGADHASTTLTFHGLITLGLHARESGFGTGTQTFSTREAHFSGDWAGMGRGGQLQYNAKISMVMTGYGAMDNLPLTLDCQVGDELPAARINPQLSGNAKQVSCVQHLLGHASTSDNYYLEDYGLFVAQHKSDPSYDETTALQVASARP